MILSPEELQKAPTETELGQLMAIVQDSLCKNSQNILRRLLFERDQLKRKLLELQS